MELERLEVDFAEVLVGYQRDEHFQFAFVSRKFIIDEIKNFEWLDFGRDCDDRNALTNEGTELCLHVFVEFFGVKQVKLGITGKLHLFEHVEDQLNYGFGVATGRLLVEALDNGFPRKEPKIQSKFII